MSYEEQDFWGAAKPAPRPETKSQPKTKLIIVGLLVIFLASGFFGFMAAGHWLESRGVANPPDEEPSGAVTEPEQENWMNILLLGIDQRANEAARSDTIILAFLNKDTKEIKLLSIPRDTYAKIPGRGYEKLGHANAYGGPMMAVQAVEELLDLEIHRYVELNFDGFMKMVDLLGGIEMEVERRYYYPEEGIDLYPGLQRLNGYDALGYVRYRKDTSDLSRIKRQQKFLKEFAEETFQLSTVLKIPALVKEANKSIKTNFTTGEMLSLATSAKSFKVQEMVTATLPGEATYIEQISYFVHDKAETTKIIEDFLNPPEPEEEEELLNDDEAVAK